MLVAAIFLNGLSKIFGNFTALDTLDLEVKTGEFLTLLGPSGCGKTTLLKIISGFIAPTEGKVMIDGADVTDVPPEARDTALCFQSYALFPHLTVRENLEFGLKQKRIPTDQRNKRLFDVSEKLGLAPQMDKLPNQLSGGQQQRVSLGRALIMRPSVILFDEPLSNLDAKLRDQVRVEIRRIQKDYGLTAIYVTHDQSEALAMSDRIVVLSNGKIEQVDTPKQLYQAPRTGFVADFIGNANVLTGIVKSKSAKGGSTIKTAIGILETKQDAGAIDDPVSVCWRPETAVIGKGLLSGKVKHVAFQGSYTDIEVESESVTYRIQTSHGDYTEDDVVSFDVAPENVIVLEHM